MGHKRLIKRCVERAHEIGGESVVLTFEPHPRIVLGRAEGLKLLTTIEEKIELLEAEGIDNIVVIPFDESFSRLKYSAFVELYLVEKLNMRSMIVGYNHLFGHQNEGNYTLLCDLGHLHNFDVVKLPELRNDESKVSSTVIRKLIEEGEVERATKHLGREGYLIHNTQDPLKLLPPKGLYYARIGSQYLNIEVSPTGEILAPTPFERVEILHRG